MALKSDRALATRVVALLILAASVLILPACGKECDRCESDLDCMTDPEAPFCRPFNNGSRRCGSGSGATTCRVP